MISVCGFCRTLTGGFDVEASLGAAFGLGSKKPPPLADGNVVWGEATADR